jgi:hypothetical protein
LTLSPIGEQSENEDVRSAPAIWKARNTSASIKAAHMMAAGEAVAARGGTGSGFAGTGTTGTIRMTQRYKTRGRKKAPD